MDGREGHDPLPLYVLDERVEDEQAHRDPAGRRPLPHGVVQQGVIAVSRAAHELSERLAAVPSTSSSLGGVESLRGVVIHITRHLVMAPDDVVRAFDRWLSVTGGRVTTPYGSLRLSVPGPAGPPRLRVVPGRLSLRLSPVPLPVELEVMPWGHWRSVVVLHPDRRFGRAVGPHRRARYFTAGHATMDDLIGRLHALAAEPGHRPYDELACGPSSSTRIPATTA